MKVITILAGVGLTLAGIWSIIRSGTTFPEMAFILGIAMLIYGICATLSCVLERRHGNATGYLLADGVLAFLLSIIVLADRLSSDVVVPVFFGMWLLFSGLMHVLQSATIHEAGERNWKMVLGFGALAAVAGLTAFMPPITGGLSLIMLLGFYFLIQGISVIVLGLHVKNHRRERDSR